MRDLFDLNPVSAPVANPKAPLCGSAAPLAETQPQPERRTVAPAPVCPSDPQPDRHWLRGAPLWVYYSGCWHQAEVENASRGTVVVRLPIEGIALATNRYQVRPRDPDLRGHDKPVGKPQPDRHILAVAAVVLACVAAFGPCGCADSEFSRLSPVPVSGL